MAHYKTFTTSERSKQRTTIKTFPNVDNEIFIEITKRNVDYSMEAVFVCLDRTDAIAFSKQLAEHIKALD